MLAFAGTAAESSVRYGLFLALPVLEISLGLWVLCDIRASLSSAVAGLCFLTFAAVSLGPVALYGVRRPLAGSEVTETRHVETTDADSAENE